MERTVTIRLNQSNRVQKLAVSSCSDGPSFFPLLLLQWRALADSAKARSCYWRFVLLQLSILRAEILSDRLGTEVAEVEARLEEAAELVDESQPKNPNYYR